MYASGLFTFGAGELQTRVNEKKKKRFWLPACSSGPQHRVAYQRVYLYLSPILYCISFIFNVKKFQFSLDFNFPCYKNNEKHFSNSWRCKNQPASGKRWSLSQPGAAGSSTVL